MGSLNVNDIKYSFYDGDIRLIDFLRDVLKLKGTKEGCGIGKCGSCTVLVNDTPKRSCHLQLNQMDGKSVLTIEGLSNGNKVHPIQKAFIDAGAVQCGFCTPGLILVTKALLNKYPNPTDQQIKKSLSGNLCRCTGYQKIIDAVKLASKFMQSGNNFSKMNVNKIISKRDAEDKVLGKSVYGDDLDIENQCYAGLVRSSKYHAKILKIETEAALKIDGVIDIWTAKDVPGVNMHTSFIKDQPIIADQSVRYKGEPIVVVVAETKEALKKGVDAVKVQYEELKPIHNMEESITSKKNIHINGNVAFKKELEFGNINDSKINAEVKIVSRFQTPMVEHAYLEPEAGIAYADDEGILNIFGPTQAPHIQRDQIASFLNVNSKKIRVKQSVIGGAFGAKYELSIHCFIALSVLRNQRPVKMLYTREESFLSTVKRHPFIIDAELFGDNNGVIDGIKMDIIADTGAYTASGPAVLTRSLYHAMGPYSIPNIKINGQLVYTNNPISSAMRGFGVPQVAFATESMIDMYAKKCDISPIQVRLLNALKSGGVSSIGQTMGDDFKFEETLNAIKPYIINNRQLTHVNSDDSIRKGIGIASFWYGIGGTNVPNKVAARVMIEQCGKITVYSGTTEIGQGSETIYTQLASRYLGNQPIEKITVINGDSVLCPDALATNASRQAYLYGNALINACNTLQSKITKKAETKLGLKLEEIEVVESGVINRANRKFFRFNEFIDSPLVGGGVFDMQKPILKDGSEAPYKIYSTFTALAEVNVNITTGNIDVNKITVAYDSGDILNYQTAEGQSEGGVSMGIGYALKEKFENDITLNFDTYKIPNIKDSCTVESIFIEDTKGNDLKIKGLGEMPAIAIAPAITNAIFDACSIRFYEIPVTKDKLLDAFKQ